MHEVLNIVFSETEEMKAKIPRHRQPLPQTVAQNPSAMWCDGRLRADSFHPLIWEILHIMTCRDVPELLHLYRAESQHVHSKSDACWSEIDSTDNHL